MNRALFPRIFSIFRGGVLRSGAGLAGALLIAMPATFAQTVLNVPGTSNPFLAGMPNGTTSPGGDSAPAQSPVLFAGFSGGDTLTFSVTGSVSFTNGASGSPPDGGSVFARGTENGISDFNLPLNLLLGVFLDASQPDGFTAPAGIDFSTGSSLTFATLSPQLREIFFIGDGLTGNATGSVQQFIAPAGATRLFLGIPDGTGWNNNFGAFSVTVTTAIPEPGRGRGGVRFGGAARRAFFLPHQLSERNGTAGRPAPL